DSRHCRAGGARNPGEPGRRRREMPETTLVNGERLWDTVIAMAAVGRTPSGGVRRLALSDEDRDARDLLIRWLRDAGCAVRVDDLGNIYGRVAGTDPEAAPVVCGSHLDPVPTGGRFDGALWVLAALGTLRVPRGGPGPR